MNERIKELIEQATTIEYGVDNGFDRVTFDKEKFAELIVKECMDIARNVGNISEPDDWAKDRCYEIEQRIQDRFGVEE
jgi:hypothetical protein